MTQEGEKAVARGKCWAVGDGRAEGLDAGAGGPIPNRHGNPGLFTVSLVGQFKSEMYYDNILVTPNHPAEAPHAAAGADNK